MINQELGVDLTSDDSLDAIQSFAANLSYNLLSPEADIEVGGGIFNPREQRAILAAIRHALHDIKKVRAADEQ